MYIGHLRKQFCGENNVLKFSPRWLKETHYIIEILLKKLGTTFTKSSQEMGRIIDYNPEILLVLETLKNDSFQPP